LAFPSQLTGAERQQETQNVKLGIDQDALDDALRLIKDLVAQVEDLQKRNDALAEERELLIHKREAMEKDVTESRDALASARDELEKAHAREDILPSELETQGEAPNDQHSNTESDLSTRRKELEDEKFCNGVLRDLVGKLNYMNDDLEEKHRKATEENKFLRTQNRNFTRSIGRLQKLSEERDHAEVTKENMALHEECHFLRSQKRGYTKAITKLENEMAQAFREKEVIVEIIDTMTLTNEQLQNTLTTTESEHSKELYAAISRNKWLDEQPGKSQQAIMDLASKIKALRQAHSDEIDEASEHEVRLAKEIMTQRAQAQDVEVQLKK
jgi:hypothetical protein